MIRKIGFLTLLLSVSVSAFALSDEKVKPHKRTPLPTPVFEKVHFEQVKQAFHQENKMTQGSNRHAWYNIKRAQSDIVEKEQGGWLAVNLPIDVALNIFLPMHHHGGKTLVERFGKTPREAATRYLQWADSSKPSDNPCFSAIQYHLNNPGKRALFLSVEPVDDTEAYQRIANKTTLTQGRLAHLDGLHRLVALALMDKPPATIKAYIASKSVAKPIDGLGLVSQSRIKADDS